MKKIISKLLAVLMMGSIATGSVSAVSASTHDSNFSMPMHGGNETSDELVIVEANSINYETMYFVDRYSRYKENTSSIYLYVSSVTNYYYTPVVGIYGVTDTYRSDFASYCDAGNYYSAEQSVYCTNQTGTSSAIKKVSLPSYTGTYLITNLVRESGYHHAALGMKSEGTVTGAWSPDSSGSYTTIP